jgi:hypothetical protein
MSLKAAQSAATQYLQTGDLNAFDRVKEALSHVFHDTAPAYSRVLMCRALVALSGQEITQLAYDLRGSRCPLCAHAVTGARGVVKSCS